MGYRYPGPSLGLGRSPHPFCVLLFEVGVMGSVSLGVGGMARGIGPAVPCGGLGPR